MRVKGVTSMSLLLAACGCGEQNILGFWHQLDPVINTAHRRAYVRVVCRECGATFYRIFQLTTGKGRRRLLPWSDWFWSVAPYLPQRVFQRVCGWALWLELNVAL